MCGNETLGLEKKLLAQERAVAIPLPPKLVWLVCEHEEAFSCSEVLSLRERVLFVCSSETLQLAS